MSLLPVLSPLITLADKLQVLHDVLRERDANRFDRLIQPLYDDLKLVHADYSQMLMNTKHTLESTRSISKAKKSLQLDRTKLVSIRHGGAIIAEELAKSDKLRRYHAFFSSVYHYLIIYGGVFRTTSVNLLDFLDEVAEHVHADRISGNDLKWALGEFDTALNRNDEHWQSVSLEYAKLLGQIAQ